MLSEKKIENELNKKLDIILNDLEPDELKQVIQKLTNDYYLSYFNSDPIVNESIFNNLKKLISFYSGDFNVESYINYCLLLAVNSFLTNNVDNDIILKSFEVDLVNNKPKVPVNLMEKVKAKRKELYVLRNKNASS